MAISNSFNRAGTASAGYLFLLLGSAFIFAIVGGLIVTPIIKLMSISDLNTILITNALLLIAVMGMSAIITEFYYRKRYDTYLYRLKKEDAPSYPYFFAFFFYLISIPITICSTYIMEQIQIPMIFDFFSESTAMYERMLELISSVSGFWDIILIVLTMAIVPAIVEELFFRGAILSWLLAKSNRVHLSVWIVAFIFSFAHFEWSGLIARIVLGAILGYVAVYGGLYTSMLLHGLNNLMTIMYYLIFDQDIDDFSSKWIYVLMGIFSIVAVYLYVRSFGVMSRSLTVKQAKVDGYEDI